MFAWLYGRPDGWPPIMAFGHPKAAAPPPPPAPLPIPDIEGPTALAAKRRLLDAASVRSGRLSTLLTGDDNNSYAGNRLGVR